MSLDQVPLSGLREAGLNHLQGLCRHFDSDHLNSSEETPFAYRYENQDGAKFLVLCFDGMGTPRTSGVWHGYMQQALLKDGLAWISGKPLPAYIGGCPNLYTMCKGNEHAMAVALFNFYPDSVDEPIIKLDRAYANIRFLGCEGRIDGDTVTLSSPIGAYTLVAFEAYD